MQRLLRLALILIVAVGVLEGISHLAIMAPSPCLMKLTDKEQAAYHYQEKDCPTFLSGSLILLGRLDHFIENHDKSIVAGFTIVLAISTIGLWLATNRLEQRTNKLYEAGERQFKVALDGVNTARTSNQIAVFNAEQQMRAYVIAAGNDIAPHRMPSTMGALGPIEGRPHTYGISLGLKNAGHTPAINVQINVSCKKMGADIPEGFEFPDSDLYGHGVIGPQSEMQTPTIHIKAPELESIKSGEEWFYWGWVEYDDVFTGTSRHRTEFCFRIERIRFPETGSVAMGFQPTSRYNAIDWGCMRPFHPVENKYA